MSRAYKFRNVFRVNEDASGGKNLFTRMPLPTEELDALNSILCSTSVRFGKVTRAFGEESDVYVDCKLTTCSRRAIPLIGRAFLRKMAERNWRPEAVGGLTFGADPIAMAIARESLNAGYLINTFIVRKEPKKHGMQRFIEGLDATSGKQVVVIDDVCTRGGSTAQAHRESTRCRNAGPGRYLPGGSKNGCY